MYHIVTETICSCLLKNRDKPRYTRIYLISIKTILVISDQRKQAESRNLDLRKREAADDAAEKHLIYVHTKACAADPAATGNHCMSGNG